MVLASRFEPVVPSVADPKSVCEPPLVRSDEFEVALERWANWSEVAVLAAEFGFRLR